MIVAFVVLVLFAVSVQVRRVINEMALTLICVLVWMFMMVAIPLESPSRSRRVMGLGALGFVLAACWVAGQLVVSVIRSLP